MEDLGDHADLGPRAADRLADVRRLDARKLLTVLLDERGDPAEQARAVGRGDRAPGRKGRLRRGDGSVGLLGRSRVDLADDLLGRRVENSGQERSSR
jgi:hypothetical protein